MRSGISSKLIFASCVRYFNRAYYGFRGEQNLTKSDNIRQIWQAVCRTQQGYICGILPEGVAGQEVSRDPAQAWCLGSCGSLDAHAVGAARTGTMMRTSSALLNTRRRYISPKGFTPVWRQSDDPGWIIQSCCIRVMSGALDPTYHSTSSLLAEWKYYNNYTSYTYKLKKKHLPGTYSSTSTQRITSTR